jgi:DNA-binding transcriptional LysR family regulator
MALEPRALVYTVTLARFGSFARAAKALSVSQPALSRAIAGLEESLGVRLFDRHARGATLTPRGEHFVRQANAILDDLKSLEETTAVPSLSERSSVRVGIGPMLAGLLAPTALARFVRDHPAVDLHVFVDYGDQLVRRLRERELELVISGGVTFARDPDLEVVAIPPQALKVYVRPEHPLAGSPRATPEDFAKYCVAFVFPSSDRNLSSAYVRTTLGVAPRLILANNVETIRELVIATDAIGVEIAPLIEPELARGRFRELRPTHPLPRSKPLIAWHRDRSRSEPIRSLIACVEAELGVVPRAVASSAR